MIHTLRRALGDRWQLSDAVLHLLAAHWQLLMRWNQTTNLTAVTDPEVAAQMHYADSLAALHLLAAGPVLDIGSGGGFPGIVLAIALPSLHFTLLEPRRKRASFLRTVQARLALNNVAVLCGRIEDKPDQSYAHAVSRAVFSDPTMFAAAAAWLAPGGSLLAYRAADAPAADGNDPVIAHPYKVGGRTRRIDVWTFAQAPS